MSGFGKRMAADPDELEQRLKRLEEGGGVDVGELPGKVAALEAKVEALLQQMPVLMYDTGEPDPNDGEVNQYALVKSFGGLYRKGEAGWLLEGQFWFDPAATAPTAKAEGAEVTVRRRQTR